jgi:hypothetical protein
MKCIWFIGAIALVLLAIPSRGLAQTASPDRDTAPVTGMKPDRVTAPRWLREGMAKREAAKRQRRAECRAKAKAEKVPLWKRPAYVKRCRAGSTS